MLNIVDAFVDPIINDLMTQNFYTYIYKSTYLTNREIDQKLMYKNEYPSKRNLSNNIYESLAHIIPSLPNANLRNLIGLRQKEGEAFEVYRLAISNFLQNIKDKEVALKMAFEDEIKPEINKINQTIKNSKKLIYSDMKKDTLVLSLFVTIGLFANILPQNLGEIIASLGGINSLGKFANNFKKLTTTDIDVNSNKYFFLWKLSPH